MTGSFPGSSAGKESACNVGDLGLIPGLGRSPREGHGNPLQCSEVDWISMPEVLGDFDQHILYQNQTYLGK